MTKNEKISHLTILLKEIKELLILLCHLIFFREILYSFLDSFQEKN